MTATQDQENTVQSEMINFAEDKKPFTALDITLASNKVTYIPHRTVRDIVKNSLGTLDGLEEYTTSTIEVELDNGVTAKAVLYHHVDYDPEDYTERSKTLSDEPPAMQVVNTKAIKRKRTSLPASPVAAPVVTLDDDASSTSAAQKLLDDLGSVGNPTKDNDNDDILSFGK